MGPGALDEGRDWRRITLAVVPWVLAAVLGLLGVVSARGAPAAPGPTATSAAPADAADATTSTVPDEPTGTAAGTPAPVPAPGHLPPEVELAVLLTARNAMGTAGLAGPAGGGDDRWPLDARLAAVEEVTAGFAVAVVHGLVLEQDDEGWHGPSPRAVAVLLQTTAAPVVVGDAWPLPPPTAHSAMPELRPVEDPDPDIVAPLTDVGWSVEQVLAVEASGDGLLRIALQGTPPGDSSIAEHVLWLLDAPGGPRLLPLTATTEHEELP